MRDLENAVKKYLKVIIGALLVLIAFEIFEVFDRRAKTNEVKQATTLSRSMLNARAQIQIILINANLEGRRLNAIEVDQIKVLWRTAEYDQADNGK